MRTMQRCSAAEASTGTEISRAYTTGSQRGLPGSIASGRFKRRPLQRQRSTRVARGRSETSGPRVPIATRPPTATTGRTLPTTNSIAHRPRATTPTIRLTCASMISTRPTILTTSTTVTMTPAPTTSADPCGCGGSDSHNHHNLANA